MGNSSSSSDEHIPGRGEQFLRVAQSTIQTSVVSFSQLSGIEIDCGSLTWIGSPQQSSARPQPIVRLSLPHFSSLYLTTSPHTTPQPSSERNINRFSSRA